MTPTEHCFSLPEIDAMIHGLLQKELLLRANKTLESNIQRFINYCVALAQASFKSDNWKFSMSYQASAKGLDMLPLSVPAEGDIRVIEEVGPRRFGSSYYIKLGHIFGRSPMMHSDRAYNCGEKDSAMDIEPIMIDGQAWNRSVFDSLLFAQSHLLSGSRLDIRDPTELNCELCQFFENDMSEQRAWLAHAHSTMAKLSRRYSPEEYYIGESLTAFICKFIARTCCSFEVQLSYAVLSYQSRPMLQHIEFSLRNTFMDPDCVPSSTPSVVYLFYRHIEFDDQGRVQPPEMFWTDDVTGQRRWSEEELEEYMGEFSLSSGTFDVDVLWEEISWPWYVYDMILEVQKACGFETSDDFAKFLDTPSTYRVEVEPSEMRFEAQSKLLDCVVVRLAD